jgi:hypothetical protein
VPGIIHVDAKEIFEEGCKFSVPFVVNALGGLIVVVKEVVPKKVAL